MRSTLSNKRRLGQYVGPDGKSRSIWKAKRGGWDVYFYLHRFVPVLITESEFFHLWKKDVDF